MEEQNLLQQIKQKGDERYSICKECPEFSSTFKQCRQCGCFMPAKVLMPFMSCPIGKW